MFCCKHPPSLAKAEVKAAPLSLSLFVQPASAIICLLQLQDDAIVETQRIIGRRAGVDQLQQALIRPTNRLLCCRCGCGFFASLPLSLSNSRDRRSHHQRVNYHKYSISSSISSMFVSALVIVSESVCNRPCVVSVNHAEQQQSLPQQCLSRKCPL